MGRRRVSSALAVSVGAVGLVAAAVSAAPLPTTIAGQCSSSGDVCTAIMNRGGAVYLELSLAAKYAERYELCARPPGGGAAGYVRCGSYPVLRRGSVWGSSVKYYRHAPVVGRGVYRIWWKIGGQQQGPILRFRLPL
jgi:hypothetical protein